MSISTVVFADMVDSPSCPNSQAIGFGGCPPIGGLYGGVASGLHGPVIGLDVEMGRFGVNRWSHGIRPPSTSHGDPPPPPMTIGGFGGFGVEGTGGLGGVTSSFPPKTGCGNNGSSTSGPEDMDAVSGLTLH